MRTRSLSTEGLEVRVSAEKALGPARLASFRIVVTIPEIEERHKEGVLRAVKSCLIHYTLLNSPVNGNHSACRGLLESEIDRTHITILDRIGTRHHVFTRILRITRALDSQAPRTSFS
jgi:hypothetical protein